MFPQKHRATKKETADELPPSCCNNSAFSVQLDEATMREIVGTDAALASDSQRLQLYEHVLEKTAKHPAFEEENAAFAELVGVTKRDQQKRRRHRKSKPTLNEELRQLVDLQMEALQRQQAAEAAAAARELVSSGRRKRSRSRSPERQRHRRPEKREREMEREREKERERERERKRHRKHRSRSRSRSHSRSLHRRKHHKQHRSRDRY